MLKVIICVHMYHYKYFKSKYDAAIMLPIMGIISDAPSLKQYLKPYQRPPTLKLQKVQSDCQLREQFTETMSYIKQGFMRGHAYYEFTNEVENILEGKEVLLQDKQDTEKWFRLAPPEEVAGRLKLYGEGIARSSYGDQYRVFIQSFGSGARHLPGGSWILYNRGEDQVTYCPS